MILSEQVRHVAGCIYVLERAILDGWCHNGESLRAALDGIAQAGAALSRLLGAPVFITWATQDQPSIYVRITEEE